MLADPENVSVNYCLITHFMTFIALLITANAAVQNRNEQKLVQKATQKLSLKQYSFHILT